jgi:hypothetical protein
MQEHIAIAGDSNGCGEWTKQGKVVHTGLQHYLTNANYNVFNFSTAGCDVQNIIDQVKTNRKLIKKCKYTFVFGTDNSRGIGIKSFWRSKENIDFYKNRSEQRNRDFITALDEAKLENIVVMGVQSPFDKELFKKTKYVQFAFNIFDMLFPNIKGYELHFESHINTIPNDSSRELIDYIWNQNKIYQNYRNSELLQPDRYHFNRHAHKIIFEQLQKIYGL